MSLMRETLSLHRRVVAVIGDGAMTGGMAYEGLNNLGHSDEAPGCFRCHDKKHQTAEGQRIGAKCSTCHAVLADEEEDPEILQALKP